MNTPTLTPTTATPRAATADSSAVSPDARRLWRGSRGILAAIAVALAAGALIGLLSSDDSGALDPRSATSHGSRAVAELLDQRGVSTVVVTTATAAAAAAGPGTTLLVARPEALTGQQRQTLAEATAAGGGRTVLVAPDQTALSAFAPGVTATGPHTAGELDPACLTADRQGRAMAERAGSAELGGYAYLLSGSGSVNFACYPVAGDAARATLVSLDADRGGETVLLGSPDILYNQNLDEYGNASLALQLLGSRSRLVWYLPSAADAPTAEEESSFLELLHPGWTWGSLQLAVAVVLAALWRGRRLGPVVTERLPVAVRAAETTEGRARLYHRAGARDQAAGALRAAARSRIAPLAGVPPDAAHSPGALPTAVAARTGETPAAVTGLLFGPPPGDDAALVRLADDLDALERRLAPHATTTIPAAPPEPPPTTPPPTTDKDRSP